MQNSLKMMQKPRELQSPIVLFDRHIFNVIGWFVCFFFVLFTKQSRNRNREREREREREKKKTAKARAKRSPPRTKISTFRLFFFFLQLIMSIVIFLKIPYLKNKIHSKLISHNRLLTDFYQEK